MSSYAPGRSTRPKSVQTAVMLIWVRIAVGLIAGLVSFFTIDDQLAAAGIAAADRSNAEGGIIIGAVIALVISVAIPVILAIFIGKGHNWARIVYTVLAVIGLVVGLLGLIGAAQLGTFNLILSIVGLALTAATLFFLFRPDANAYFKS
ncbi:hypothetical protein [uncultured Nocardioides sp.]|uniref:hypothetical protein n=1 Tax=uncultured Nocardioides sp. TaxID=198441 RepID=UPI002609E5B0|nr:hypothetical protein [uncultured Nocardioides sp.]